MGGDGFDTADYSDAGGSVTVDLSAGTASGAAGNDTLEGIESIRGSDHADTLIGDDANNTLSGGAGDDILDGGAGDDLLVGGAGSNTIEGGAGNDTVTYEGGSAINIDLSEGTATDADGTDSISGVENVIGSGQSDTITGDAGDNIINAGAGADTITGGGGDDTLTGGSGADVYVVGPDDGTDTITDFAVGEDQIDIRALGIDTYGELYENMSENENGDLVIDFGEGTSMVLEGVSLDEITADSFIGVRDIVGTSGDDTISGTDGQDTISGLDGNDTIYGLEENDSIFGGAGDDT